MLSAMRKQNQLGLVSLKVNAGQLEMVGYAPLPPDPEINPEDTVGDDWPEDYIQDLIPTDWGPEAGQDAEQSGTEAGNALEALAAGELADGTDDERDAVVGNPEAAAPPTVPRPCSCTVEESWMNFRKNKRVSA